MRHSVLLLMLALSAMLPAQAQSTGSVMAEALGQANLRAAATIDSEVLGEIRSGETWPVLARSELFPWLLLGDEQGRPMGWVFADLVRLDADSGGLPLSTLDLSAGDRPATAIPTSAKSATGAPTQTATPAAPDAVYGQLAGTVNIRQGPGVEYARIAVGQAGERFRLTARHSQVPWVQVIEPRAPAGRAWIALDLLQLQGDLAGLPLVTQAVMRLPTLSPTPAPGRVRVEDNGHEGLPQPPAGLVETGQQAWALLQAAGFERESGRPAALYILDLASRVSFGFHENLEFSGTSIQKINILAALFSILDRPLDRDLAVDVANTMICSENVATNRLLARIGDGDVWAGAARVTSLLAEQGMQASYILTPYTIPGQTPEPPGAIRARSPQIAGDAVAQADPWNRIRARDVGRQLASLHYCAQGEEQSLTLPGLEARECHQALQVMRANTVDALLKAGVPADTSVAHKHGWIADTHSNAALFTTPGGDYVIVLLLHQPQWLEFRRSLPLMAEVSRLVYNFYNPQAQQTVIREGFIPEADRCNFTASPLIEELLTIP